MKRRLLIAFTLSLSMLLPLGCATATSPTPPLAPGYQTQADQTMGEILAGAHAFYQSIQQESANGQMTLSATEKAAFNVFGTTLNGAQSVYLAYHANPTPTTLAAAQSAVNQVQTQQAALPVPAVK